MRILIRRPTCSCPYIIRLMMHIVGISLFRSIAVCRLACLLVLCSLLSIVACQLQTFCIMVVEISAGIHIKLLWESPFQSLAYILRTEALWHWPASKLRNGHIALHKLLIVIHLPVVCLTMVIRCIAWELPLGNIHVHILIKAPFAWETCPARHIYRLLALVRYDIDNSRYGIRAIQRACRSWENLYSLYVVNTDTIPAVITTHALSVLQNNYIVIAHAVEVHESTHTVCMRRNVRTQLCQSLLKTRNLSVLQFFCWDNLNGYRGVIRLVISTCSRHSYRVKLHGLVCLSIYIHSKSRHNCEVNNFLLFHFLL